MSGRDWRNVDEQLDHAIDALNAETAPTVDDVEVESLVEIARAVRQLRAPSDPEDGFEARLVAAIPESLIKPNGNGPSFSAIDTAPLAMPLKDPRRSTRWLSLLAAVIRAVGVCALAGIIAGGLIGGLGGRAAMRMSGYMYEREHPGQVAITQSSEEPVGQISLEGTWSLVVETALFDGVAGGLLYLLVAPWLPRRSWARGLAFSGLLLLAGGWIVISSDNTDFSELGSPVVNVLMFSGLIAAYGLAVPWIADRLGHAAAPALSGGRSIGLIAARASTAIAGALGLLMMTMMVIFLVYSAIAGIVGFSPGSAAQSLVLLALISLVAIRVAVALPRSTQATVLRGVVLPRRIALVLGAVVALTGVGLTLWSIVEILSR